MHYRISDVARVLGFTPNALHFFEKEKIITVQKKQNGYRSYDIADVFRLLSYEKYRSMGYSLKTIRTQFEHETDNRDQIKRRVEAQKEDALRKAAHYMRLAQGIERHLDGIRKIDTLLDRYELLEVQDSLFIYDGEGGWISKNKESQMLLQQWVGAMPLTRLALLGAPSGLTPQPHREGIQNGTLGYMIEESLAQELSLPVSLNVHRQPASTCLHTIVTTDESFLTDPARVFDGILQEAARQNLTPCGAPFGTILLVEVLSENHLRPYHSLCLPIRR